MKWRVGYFERPKVAKRKNKGEAGEIKLNEKQGEKKRQDETKRKGEEACKIAHDQQCSRGNCAVWQMNCSAGTIFIC